MKPINKVCLSKTKEYIHDLAIRYRLSPKGYARYMYLGMKSRVRRRPTYMGKTVDFSFEEFLKYLEGTDYAYILGTYIGSGRKRSLAPSIDRIDNNGSYTLSNIRLITHGQNASKGAKYERNKNPKRRATLIFCKKGHKFTEESTIHRKDGFRGCRDCEKAWKLNHPDRHKRLTTQSASSEETKPASSGESEGK